MPCCLFPMSVGDAATVVDDPAAAVGEEGDVDAVQ
jgi:hypothetical protein